MKSFEGKVEQRLNFFKIKIVIFTFLFTLYLVTNLLLPQLPLQFRGWPLDSNN